MSYKTPNDLSRNAERYRQGGQQQSGPYGSSSGPSGPYGSSSGPPPRRSKQGPRWLIIGAVVGVIALVVIGGGVFLLSGDSGEDDDTTPAPAESADEVVAVADAVPTATETTVVSALATATDIPPTATHTPIPPTNTPTTPEIIEQVRPAVVLVQAFYDGSDSGRQGSGFIIDGRGTIITNAHVVEGASQVAVLDADGTILPADTIGESPCDDVAVLQISDDTQTYPSVAIAPDQPLVGEGVFAMGFPLNSTTGSNEASVHFGQVNRVNAQIDNLLSLIEHQAPLNRGNSGGPLLNMRGEVVGINTLVLNPGVGSTGSGLLYAIDAMYAQQVWQRLIDGEPYDGVLLARGDSLAGEIGSHVEYNCFVFDAQASDVVTIDAVANGGLLDTEMLLYTPDNRFLTYDDDSGDGSNARISVQLPTTGRYQIVVRSFDGQSVGSYDLSLR